MTGLFRTIFLFFTLLLSVLLPLTVYAHKLHIFAWPEGNFIHGETTFSGNKKAQQVRITVQNAADNSILLTTHTDKQGNFTFKLPEKAIRERLDLLLIVDSGDGHRGQWTLPADEYLATSAQDRKNKQSETAPFTAALSAIHTDQTVTRQIDENLLRRIVAEELEKQLAPIRRILAESRDKKPTLQDILGGSGYILGLAGRLAWVRAANKK